MCSLGFVGFFFLLKEFWCIFFPAGISCFTVLGLTKHLPVHVLNSPSMHGYRAVGGAPRPFTSLLAMKTHVVKWEPTAVPTTPQQRRWPWKQTYGQ